MAVPAAIVWQPMTGELVLVAIAMGLLGVGAQAAIVQGYRIGEATAVAPFDYSRLLFATLFGLVLFTEVPDLWTFAGAAVIVVSTVYIARREARLGRSKSGPAPH